MEVNDEHYFLRQLDEDLLKAAKNGTLCQEIVNAPFQNRLQMTKYGLGIVVFLRVNENGRTIDRISLSNTELAEGSKRMSAKKFEDIKIPIEDERNIIAKAIKTGQPQSTVDWEFLFTPDLTGVEARFNQAGAGVDCSFVYPLTDLTTKGALIFSYFEPLKHIGQKQTKFMQSYARMVSQYIRHSKD